MTTKSVSCCRYEAAAEQRAEDRHRSDPGKLLRCCARLSVDSRPAIAKLWPSRNSIVVRASRLVSDGTVKPEIWYGLREVELAHRRRQTQIDDAVCQDRRHERQLHAERLVVDGDDRHAAGAPGCTTGTGNSPPARKEAVSPESATKSGSAKRRMRPFVSSAVRVTSRLAPLVARLASATPKGLRTREQSRRSREYRKAGAPLPRANLARVPDFRLRQHR